jgi:hypothetical protein
MTRYEDHCCGCATDSYPCQGSSCPNRNVKVTYCDKCGAELPDDEIYEVDGDDLCEDCLKERFLKEGD